ncbi:hypothetical protein BASA83_009110 [Batrachochytrium salamandrivorans]|nr:hypothetical protein BASA83_009110 [Batrachochytrium salamandrivorans]
MSSSTLPETTQEAIRASQHLDNKDPLIGNFSKDTYMTPETPTIHGRFNSPLEATILPTRSITPKPSKSEDNARAYSLVTHPFTDVNIRRQYLWFLHLQHHRLASGSSSDRGTLTNTRCDLSCGKHIAAFNAPPRFKGEFVSILNLLHLLSQYGGAEKITNWRLLATLLGVNVIQSTSYAHRLKKFVYENHLDVFLQTSFKETIEFSKTYSASIPKSHPEVQSPNSIAVSRPLHAHMCRQRTESRIQGNRLLGNIPLRRDSDIYPHFESACDTRMLPRGEPRGRLFATRRHFGHTIDKQDSFITPIACIENDSAQKCHSHADTRNVDGEEMAGLHPRSLSLAR